MDNRQIRALPGPGEMVLDPGVSRSVQSGAGNIARGSESIPILPTEGFRDYAQGAAALGRGIAQAGDAFGKIAGVQLQAVAIRQEADAQNAMTAAEGELQAKLAAEPDELKWEGLAQAHISELRDKLGKMPVQARAREAIDMGLARWEAHTIGAVKTQSARESIQRARGAIQDKVELAVANNDPGAVAANLAGGVAAGLMSEDHAALTEKKAADRIQRNQEEQLQKTKAGERETFQQMLIDDPWQAQEMLTATDANNGGRNTWFPNLDAGDRLRMQHAAEEEVRKKQFEVIETLKDGVVMGQVDDHAIEAMAPIGRLGPQDVEKMKQFRQKYVEAETSRLPLDDEAAIQLSADIDKFDPATMEPMDALHSFAELSQRAELITARGGDVGRMHHGVFNQRLYQLDPLHRKKKTEDKLPDGVESDFNELMKMYSPPTLSTLSDKTEAEKDRARKDYGIYVNQRSQLFNDLKKEVETNPGVLDPMKGGLDGWIANKWKNVRAASRLPVLPGPDATLFPAGSADPNEAWKSILKK